MGKTLLGLHRWRSPHNCSDSLGDTCAEVVEARMGKIAFSGRYHRQRKITDDYKLSKKVLGSGYNGQVHMATSVLQPNQKYAVKSFKLDKLKSDERKLLVAEVENYLSMDHPHITRLYDVYESKHELHLVMECMEGGELFDRVTEKKRFSDEEARNALRQMLLALNYIHGRGIVHRDIKLENFMYDRKDSGHLKLIDFGFSKMLDPSGKEKMTSCLGTASYVAPEVLKRNATSQCDLWSLGVVGFILLAGYMPFAGPEATQFENIAAGRMKLKPERWNAITPGAKDFVMSLLQVDPSKRLTAEKALGHPWIANNEGPASADVNVEVVEAMRQFGHASKPRRCCMEMLAWSLSNEERAKVRNDFLCLDASHKGTITLGELKHAMEDKLFLADDHEAVRVFEALDYNHDQEIHYSDFLAAMVDTQIELNDDLLNSAFRRFDADGSGYITMDDLRDVLGSRIDGEKVESFMEDVDLDMDGRISLNDFTYYLRQDDAKMITVISDETCSHKLPGSRRDSSFRNLLSRSKGKHGFRHALRSVARGLKVYCKGNP